LVACSDGAGPRGTAPLSLALSTRQAAPGAPVGPAISASLQSGAPETFPDGSNTLVISSVELVLRELELKRVEEIDCGTPGDDACEEFETGPILLDVPLGGGTERMFTATVAAGTYDEVEFEIHKPEDDGNAVDRDFLAAHPDFARISIRVRGTFNGADVTYTSDLNAEQELALDPPLVVEEGTPVSVTVRLDLDGWFRSGDGTLVNPQTANKGGANENLVRDNIIKSFESFQDDDVDGLDDDHEDPDGGH
jgi:hypothetical protein